MNMTYDHMEYMYARDFVRTVMEFAPNWEDPGFDYPRDEAISPFQETCRTVVQKCMRERLDTYFNRLVDELKNRPLSLDLFMKSVIQMVVNLYENVSKEKVLKERFFHVFQFCMHTSVYAFFVHQCGLPDVSELAVRFISETLFRLKEKGLLSETIFVSIPLTGENP